MKIMWITYVYFSWILTYIGYHGTQTLVWRETLTFQYASFHEDYGFACKQRTPFGVLLTKKKCITVLGEVVQGM